MSVQEKLCVWLDNRNLLDCRGANGFLKYGMCDGQITLWDFEIDKPTEEELNGITEEDIIRFRRKIEKQNCSNKYLYSIIEKLCERLSINIDELV
jgi:hypothetical protein